MVAALTPEERGRVRYFTGYPDVSPGSALAAGMLLPMPTLFLVESAMDKLTPTGLEAVRALLQKLEQLECKMLDPAVGTLMAAQIGEITTRGAKRGETAPDLVEREVQRWALRLCGVLGVPPYAFSSRFRRSGGSGNIPIRRS